jgi:SRSO17 transposase
MLRVGLIGLGVLTPALEPGHVGRLSYKGQDWPECWLIAEWPPGAAEPTRYWLSTLPATTRRADLVRAAKQRWRIEHDYRE